MYQRQEWLVNKFSVPFSGDSPTEFMVRLNSVREYVHDVFLGLDSFFPGIHRYTDEKRENVMTFVRQYARTVPIMVTLNLTFPKRLLTALNISPEELSEELLTRNSVVEFMVDSGVTGIIASEPSLIKAVLRRAPKLAVHSSIDSPLDPLTDSSWNGIHLDAYNVMRDDGVNLARLKELKSLYGVPLKVMVNCSCFKNCTCTRQHIVLDTLLAFGVITEADYKRGATALIGETSRANYDAHVRSTMVLPRWMPHYDGLIDVVKLDGKNQDVDWIFGCVDAYLNARDDVTLGQLVVDNPCCLTDATAIESIDYVRRTPVSVLPDRLLTCGGSCKELRCSLCAKVKGVVDKLCAG